ISSVLSGILDFAIGLLLVIPLMAYYHPPRHFVAPLPGVFAARGADGARRRPMAFSHECHVSRRALPGSIPRSALDVRLACCLCQLHGPCKVSLDLRPEPHGRRDRRLSLVANGPR